MQEAESFSEEAGLHGSADVISDAATGLKDSSTESRNMRETGAGAVDMNTIEQRVRSLMTTPVI